MLSHSSKLAFRRPRIARALQHPARFALPSLEPRLLMSAAIPTGWGDADAADGPRAALLVPALSSRPDASAHLYLDFDGDVARRWGSYDATATPAFSTDADDESFSPQDLDAIREIFARVAEKFSPFDLNVTTVDPGTMDNKVALRAVVGGDGEWSGGSHGGIGYVGAFYNSAPNIVYAFSVNLGNGVPKYTAEAIAHEAGHAFGLEHQSLYDGAGNIIQQYHEGDGQVAPIMGVSYEARGVWWNGTNSESSTSMQDDMAILTGPLNGFGYRPDDHGDGVISAAELTVAADGVVSAAGVIERTTDKDYFSFVTATGPVTLYVDPAEFGAMLDLRVELRDHTGALLASQDTAGLGEVVDIFLTAGSYRLGVFSHGNYGDVGQYSVSGFVIPPALTLGPPLSPDATETAEGHVQVTWVDGAVGELGYRIQRTTDGGATWLDWAIADADATSYVDDTLDPGDVAAYRLYAFNDSEISAPSERATVVLLPATPRGLTATAVSSRRIRLEWDEVSGAGTFVIERAKGDNTTWKPIGLASGTRETFDDTGLSAGLTYRYRVRASNAAGYSQASVKVTATTLSDAGVPAAPSKMTVGRPSEYVVRLTWRDNSTNELGFRIQWRVPRGPWDTLGYVDADRTSASLFLFRRDAEFRIAAYNKAGTSTYAMPTTASPAAVTADTAPWWMGSFFSTRPIRRADSGSLFGGLVA